MRTVKYLKKHGSHQPNNIKQKLTIGTKLSVQLRVLEIFKNLGGKNQSLGGDFEFFEIVIYFILHKGLRRHTQYISYDRHAHTEHVDINTAAVTVAY